MKQEINSVARVNVLDAPHSIDKLFDYSIPYELFGRIEIGSFVVVPFGGANRKRIALVRELTDSPSDKDPIRLKPLLSLFNSDLTLNSESLGLCSFLKEHTFCTVGEAVRCLLPSCAFSPMREFYAVSASPSDQLEAIDEYVYNYISKSGKTELEKIKKDIGSSANIEKILAKLLSMGLISREVVISETAQNHSFLSDFYTLALGDEQARKAVRGVRQTAIVEALIAHGRLTGEELKNSVSATHVVLKALTDRKVINVECTDIFRQPYDTISIPPDDNILSPKQNDIFNKIVELYNIGKPKAVLLHGVTGSGKTRVIKSVIDRVLNSGRQVIMLVPEISLTPQTVRLFRSYYGNKVAVLHSGLSAGEKYDAWRCMKNGTVNICIGTRSAIFAPFDNIGLIVIDEEQEHTYKSDMNPKYHARDVARYRCAENNALMLLASATPSVESYAKAQNGIYTLLELNERYGEAELPKAIVTDLREDVRNGMVSPIGTVLRDEIEQNLRLGEQAILFLNRRGYNKYLSCPMCGETVMCPHCSIALTYHITGNNSGYLCCHYCGYREPKPDTCPNCKSRHIQYLGFGTQKIEEELRMLFPDSRIMRMDADTTSTKFAYDRILERFRAHEADILLGTQMVTKGHDFPDVTLVGVLSADMALYVDDYRANEKTFSLLTQVIGRAGRASKSGRAIIQTFNPMHPILKMSAEQDYAAFFRNEIAFRKALVFPPFCDMFTITFTHDEEGALQYAAISYTSRLKELINSDFKDVALIIFGPFEAPIYRLKNKYRMRLVTKCKDNKRTRELFRTMEREYSINAHKKVTITLDINSNVT